VRPHDVKTRTGLSRRQQRYCEEKGHLGKVERDPTGERVFTGEQVAFLERVAALRAIGINLEEAAAVAAEGGIGLPKVDPNRLKLLVARSFAETTRSLRATVVLWEVMQARVAGQVIENDDRIRDRGAPS
jgi:DNA-binding transcriptional MerR regulator